MTNIIRSIVFDTLEQLKNASYKLSFTAGGLLFQESLVVAEAYHQLHDWAAVEQQVNTQNLLQSRTVSTGKRKLREVRSRLQQLTEPQLSLLVGGSPSNQMAILWLASCKRYRLLSDFASQVIREKYLTLNPRLAGSEFDAFLESQTAWHPELESVSDSTRTKLRTVAMRMMREAGVINADNMIRPAILSAEVAQALYDDSSELFLIYPIATSDIPGRAA